MRLVGATYKDAVLIPSSAVLSTPTGNLVYVVGEDGTTQAKTVTAQLQDDMYIVSEGLEGGETVISAGLIKIRPGMKVTPQIQPFEIPSYTEPVSPSTATVMDVGSFDEAIGKDIAPDKQDIRSEKQRKSDAVTDALLGQQD